ncbi:50S ribosomal protein L11 methyltransferase [Peptoniphilus sp. MSJ-1]|uniref:Ribosomal protein L11 methyltransferase n=1 Tax=Peptoniphilus ovalis TaxID=2841503 RepID=A0ABS6FID4_9FIRM|nr:50S ribosomal protein L11 methyltransferase [Peptoniphilus ovalis]MBU5669942.1 50S ribosomal protein L11 methyltransferase [Peptoniphilus ovalis]
MKYIEFSIDTKTKNRDIITGILFDYNIFTVEEISKDIVNELNQDEKDWDFIDYPLTKTGDGELILKIYPESIEQADEIKEKLESKNLGKCEFIEKDDEDWANNWKKYYKPLEIGEKIAIIPEWEDYENKENRFEIKINPGMAFGTGTHESTYMCIEMLEKYVKDGDRIFDIGCGSGILAIAALKLGAEHALAVDIDEKCISASHENAYLNNLSDKIEIKKGNLLDVVTGHADLIVSNIIAEIIVDEIKNLKNHMDKGGIFITSGIIKERRDMVIDALKENGFEIIDETDKNNWVAIVGRLNV